MKKCHTDARTEQVLELVVAGLSRAQIAKWVSEKSDWGIQTRQIDRLIAQAHVLLLETAQPHREREFSKSLRRLDMLFARSLQINDFKGCLGIEKERIALLGLSDRGRRGPAPAPLEDQLLRGSWRARAAEARKRLNSTPTVASRTRFFANTGAN
jgi:hypothetical protein